MKTNILSIIIMLLSISGCSPTDPEHPCMDKTKSDKIAEDMARWEIFKADIYSTADTNNSLALKKINMHLDSLNQNLTLTSWVSKTQQQSDLHFIKGEMYYKASDFYKSLNEFNFSPLESDYILARVCNYAKTKQYDKATALLVSKNYDIKILTHEYLDKLTLPTRRNDIVEQNKK